MKNNIYIFRGNSIDLFGFFGIVFISICLYGLFISYLSFDKQRLIIVFWLGAVLISYILSCWLLFTAEVYFDKIIINYSTRFYKKEKIVCGSLKEVRYIHSTPKTLHRISFIFKKDDGKKYHTQVGIPEEYTYTRKFLTDFFELLISKNIKVKAPNWFGE